MAPYLDTFTLNVSNFVDNLKASPRTYSTIALGLIGIYFVVGLSRSIYTAFASHLGKVPGPTLCKLSGILDAYYAVVAGARSEWIHSLHKTYGPVVRISPNLISCSDPAAIKTVYGGKFPKSKLAYQGKAINGVDHALVFIDHEQVKARRGIILPLFRRQGLDAFHDTLVHFTEGFLNQLIKESKEEGCVDMFRWSRLVAFDVIGMLAYGVDLQMTSAGKTSRLVELMAQVFFCFALRDFIPGASWLLKQDFFRQIASIGNAEPAFQGYGADVLDGMLVKSQMNEDDEKPNLIKALYKASLTDRRISRDHIATEAGAILIAGSDTTSTAITYACFELSRRPEVQRRLRAELSSIMADTDSWPDAKALEALPYLTAFIKEVFRVWPTLPGPLERTVTSGGVIINGHYIPEGTDLTMTPYTIHRNASVFPDPLAFKPERWLKETADMRHCLLTFSSGPRSCPGVNLAWAESRLLLAMIVRRFDISPSKRTNAASMAPVEHFFAIPKGMSCYLELHPVAA